jgi:hypothetical protein
MELKFSSKNRFHFNDKWYALEFLQNLSLECNPARPFPIIFTYVAFVFREKHGLVRNDLLDCIMELRKSGKNEAHEDKHSENKVKKGTPFSKQKLILLQKSHNTRY